MAVGNLTHTDVVDESQTVDMFYIMELWTDLLNTPCKPLTHLDYSVPIKTVYKDLDECISSLDLIYQMIKARDVLSDRAVAEFGFVNDTTLNELVGNSKYISQIFTQFGNLLSGRFKAIVDQIANMSDDDKQSYLPYVRNKVGYLLTDALIIADVIINRNK